MKDFSLDLEAIILAITLIYTPWLGGWRGMGEEGAEAHEQMNRQERCGSGRVKITGSPVRSRPFGQHAVPSLPPHTLTPTAIPAPPKKRCIVHFRSQTECLCCEARRALCMFYNLSTGATLNL